MGFEHELAVHWDELGRRQTIPAKDLVDDQTFADAKDRELFDESEQIRVYPRDGTATRRRHFRAEVTGVRGFDKGENSPAHNARVGALLRLEDGWSVGYQTQANEPIERIFGPLPAYNWGKEVTRILSSTALARQDVYGDSGIRMSIRKPSIAVEVVQSHYPEEATFTALLAHTAQVPSIVFFDFTLASANALVRIDLKAQALIFRSYTFAITDGALWIGPERLDQVKTSAHFEVLARKRYRGWK